MSRRAIVLSPPRDTVEPVYPDDATTIPVFLGCDDKFLPHALAVIASVMAHADARNNYDLFIVQTGIPRERMNIAAEWMERYPNATLRFIDIDPMLEEVKDDLVIMPRFGAATYFRIFAPEMFAKYKRIAYLDCDIAVLDDVAKFYRLDLGGMQAGAVRDFVMMSESLIDRKFAEFWRTQLNMEPGDDYFLAGGLVMDLELMRQEDTQRKLYKRIREIEGTRMPDQDATNTVLHGKMKAIPCEWNCLEWAVDDEEESGFFLLMNEDFLAELREARGRVKVIHFVGQKPWTMKYTGKCAGEYWRYAAETPFYRQSLEQFRRECEGGHLLLRSLATRVQEVNFALRRLFASEEKKKKYSARIRNVRMRRKGLARQKKLLETLLKEEENRNV